MLKRPLNPRFRAPVLRDVKTTTIRDKPWPVGVPIMLYNWSGAAYRSKQADVAAVMVEESLELVITRDMDDGGIVFCRDHIDGIPLHQTEGFDAAGQMQDWFRKVVKPGQTVTKHLMRFKLLPA